MMGENESEPNRKHTTEGETPCQPSKENASVLTRSLHLMTSGGYTANTLVTIAFSLIMLVVVDLMNSWGAKVLAGGIGLTILLWVIVFYVYKAGLAPPLPPQTSNAPALVNSPAPIPTLPVAEPVVPKVNQSPKPSDQQSAPPETASRPETKRVTPSMRDDKPPLPKSSQLESNSISIGNSNQISNSAIVAGNNNQVIVNAQRSLSADQRQVIAKAMAPFAQDNYRDVVTCLYGDSESAGFAQDWVQALQEAGWKIPANGYAQIAVAGKIPSMSVRVGSEERAQREPVASLLKVFEALGLPPVIWIDTTFQAERFEISIGARPR